MQLKGLGPKGLGQKGLGAKGIKRQKGLRAKGITSQRDYEADCKPKAVGTGGASTLVDGF